MEPDPKTTINIFVFDIKVDELSVIEIVDFLWADDIFQDSLDWYFGPNTWNGDVVIPSKTQITESFTDKFPTPFSKGYHFIKFKERDETFIGKIFNYCLKFTYNFEKIIIEVKKDGSPS